MLKKGNSCPAFNTHIHYFISNVLLFAILSSLALIQLIAWRWLYENTPPAPCSFEGRWGGVQPPTLTFWLVDYQLPADDSQVENRAGPSIRARATPWLEGLHTSPLLLPA